MAKPSISETITAEVLTQANPIRAFIAATQPLAGSCVCGNRGFDSGGMLVAMMAAKLHDEDEIELPLNTAECADVLQWLSSRDARGDKPIRFGGCVYGDDKTPPGDDPGFGLFLILNHVSDQLREHAQ